jgi:sporulation protein YlmC with PRC-barrel domain
MATGLLVGGGGGNPLMGQALAPQGLIGGACGPQFTGPSNPQIGSYPSMRNLLASTAVLLALSVPSLALAQAQQMQAQAQQPMTAGQPGQSHLQQAEQRLQQAIQRLEQAGQQQGDRLQQAQDEARQAIQEVRQALAQAPEDQRGRIEEAANRAEQSLDGQDSQATVQAMNDLHRELQTMSEAQQQAAQQPAGEGADIQVQQPAPQVTVAQPEPQVTVQQPQPQVTIQQPEPQVTVQQPEPQVTVQQAEPQVNVQQPGQPQVQVQNEGQPQVRVEGQDQAQVESRATVREQTQTGEQATRGATTMADQWGQMTGQEIVGKTIYGANGEEIGDVDDVVLGPQGPQDIAVVVGVGGFLGIGERNIAIPLSEIQLGPEDRLTTTLTREQVENMQPYDESSGYRAYDRNRRFGESG